MNMCMHKNINSKWQCLTGSSGYGKRNKLAPEVVLVIHFVHFLPKERKKWNYVYVVDIVYAERKPS